MSEPCQHTAKLNRDGTSRRQRLLQALLPDYVSIDERTIGDLIRFTRDFAEEINFYGSDNRISGHWREFFEADEDLEIFLKGEAGDQENFLEYVKRKSGFTQPHIALFLAFLKLYSVARNDLNQITKKHLDHYYKQILRIDEKPPVADQVFLIFKLARHVGERGHLIKSGTRVKAGKDATGQPLVYETGRDLVVNHGEVAAIKSIYTDVEGSYRLYASPVANSADGEGADIDTDDMSWKIFGGKDRREADLGFCVASPVLSLSEGYRTVGLTLKFRKTDRTRELLEKLQSDHFPFAQRMFKVFFSGEEGWISPEDEEVLNIGDDEIHPEVASAILRFVNGETAEKISMKVKDDPNRGYDTTGIGYTIGETVARRIVERRDREPFRSVNDLREIAGLGQDKIHDLIYTFRKRIHSTQVRPEEGTITIVRTLDESQPAVTAYDRSVLNDPIDTVWPAMKVLIRKSPESREELSLYTYLKDLEITAIKINVDVQGVKTNILQNDAGTLDPGKPFQPFGNRPVTGSSFYIGNREIFQKDIDKLWININWHDLPGQSFGDHYEHYTDGSIRWNSSFHTDISILDDRSWKPVKEESQLFDYTGDNQPVNPEKTLFIYRSQLQGFGRDTNMERFSQYDTGTQRGFLRLTLKGADFGHKDYPSSYSEQILNSVTHPDEALKIPEEPYTPVISELSLDYRSTVQQDLTDQAPDVFEERIEQYFHVYPFGVSEVVTTERENSFMPVFSSEGSLYIGISNLTGGRNLSLLFQVAEGSADPDYLQQPVLWSYLAGNRWKEFDERAILSDTTSKLLRSGIITFAIPGDATTRHSLLPEGCLWLRASVREETPAVSDMVDVRAQAVLATFKDQGNDPDHLANPLPAGAISKLQESDSAIREVLQPFSSFGGAVREESHAYYTRVSERLQHKNRAVTLRDYERLILEAFPSVYKVKCLNHTQFGGSMEAYSEIAPGHVSLIVVSDTVNRNAVDPLKPRTSLVTLTEIHDYLGRITSENVELHVKNPLYEEVQVEFNVKFREGIDGGYYRDVLNQEIKSYLSPWAFQMSPDVVFGGRVHKSMILHFIEKRDYVDFITCFKMYHIVPSATPERPERRETGEARATISASVLGSAPEHVIHVLEGEACACDDNDVDALKELSTDDCGC